MFDRRRISSYILIWLFFCVHGCMDVMSDVKPNSSIVPSTFNLKLKTLLDQPLTFQDDFEKGWNARDSRGSRAGQSPGAKPWRYSQMQSDIAGQTVRDPVNPANQVMQFKWQQNIEKKYDDNTMLKAHLYGEFGGSAYEEGVWSFKLYLPEKGAEPEPESTILIQWHGTPDSCESARRPPLALDHSNGKLTLTWLADTKSCTLPGSLGLRAQSIGLGSAPLNQWFNLVFHIRFDPRGQGFLRVWKDGESIINQKEMALGYQDELGAYLGFGIYQFTGKSRFSERVVLFDDIAHRRIASDEK